jgi:hypothetical protein
LGVASGGREKRLAEVDGERGRGALGLEGVEERACVLDEEGGVGVAGGLFEELHGLPHGEAGAVVFARGGEVVGGGEDEEAAGDLVVRRGAARLEFGVGGRVAVAAFLDGADEGGGELRGGHARGWRGA